MKKESLILCAVAILGSSFLFGSFVISRALTQCSNQFHFLSRDYVGGGTGSLGVLRLDQCTGEVKALQGFRLPFNPDSEIGMDQSLFVWDGINADPDAFMNDPAYEGSMSMRH